MAVSKRFKERNSDNTASNSQKRSAGIIISEEWRHRGGCQKQVQIRSDQAASISATVRHCRTSSCGFKNSKSELIGRRSRQSIRAPDSFQNPGFGCLSLILTWPELLTKYPGTSFRNTNSSPVAGAVKGTSGSIANPIPAGFPTQPHSCK